MHSKYVQPSRRFSISRIENPRFNPRPRTGSDLARPAIRFLIWPTSSFNPRPRTGSDRERDFGRRGWHRFNPRPRTGSDLSHQRPEHHHRRFQSTPPHGERLASADSKATPDSFQSTPPHGERRDVCADARLYNYVSIHAPARGATGSVYHPSPIVNVSIHAPARGATRVADDDAARVHVSIHAPARGATMRDSINWAGNEVFQSTPPHGERLFRWRIALLSASVSIHAPARGATEAVRGLFLLDVFQSTPPHGERQDNSSSSPFSGGFNPRPRTGSDVRFRIEQIAYISVSIHAPARGATIAFAADWFKLDSFNPRPRTGSDPYKRSISPFCPACFNPRPRTGSDFRWLVGILRQHRFNPRPRTGSDNRRFVPVVCTKGFNPRPRTGSDRSLLAL